MCTQGHGFPAYMNADVSVNGQRSIIDFNLSCIWAFVPRKQNPLFTVNLGFAACKTFNLFSALQIKSPVLQQLKAAPHIF